MRAAAPLDDGCILVAEPDFHGILRFQRDRQLAAHQQEQTKGHRRPGTPCLPTDPNGSKTKRPWQSVSKTAPNCPWPPGPISSPKPSTGCLIKANSETITCR